jgi:hypothetical protein
MDPCGNKLLSYPVSPAVFWSLVSRQEGKFIASERTETFLYETNLCLLIHGCSLNKQTMHLDLHVMCPLFLSDFNQNENGSTAMRKILQQ